MCETLDYLLVDAGRGWATFQGKPKAAFMNPHSTVHGGWCATLLDSAMGCAARSVLPAGQVYATADLAVRFVKAITDSVEMVRAEGKVLQAGRRAIVAEGRLVGHDGTLYAISSCTCITLPSGT